MTLNLGGEQVECEVIYTLENDGIGSYEFWGMSGFDMGTDYYEIHDIIPDDKNWNEYIDENWDEICEQIIKILEY